MLCDQLRCQLCVPIFDRTEDGLMLLHRATKSLAVLNGYFPKTHSLAVQRQQRIADDCATAEHIEGIMKLVVHLTQMLHILFFIVEILQLADMTQLIQALGGYVFCGDYPIKNEIFFKKIFKKILTR